MSTQESAALWQIRKAIRPWVESNSQPILFGCSGGADSMAMALALFLEAKDQKIVPVVVDHGLQPNSGLITNKTI